MSVASKALDRMAWPVVALIIGAGVISACQLGKAPLALQAVQQELQLGLGTASWLISAFAVIGAVLGAPIGLTVDRIGVRRTAILSLLVMGTGSALGALSNDATSLLATRVLEGLGFLGLVVAAPALIAAVAPERIRDRAMALWAIFMPTGLMLVLLAAPLLNTITWRGFWLLNAAVLISYAALLGWVVPSSQCASSKHSSILKDIKQTTAAPGPWVLGALFALFSTLFFAVFGFLPSLLTERLGVSDEAASMLSAVAVAASGVGNIVCGLLLARGVESIRLLYGSFGTMLICGGGVFSAVVPGPGIYALCLVFTFASGFVPVVIFKRAAHFAPHNALVGTTLGFAMQGNNIGLLIGPAVAGVLVAAFGWSAVSILVVACAPVAALLLNVFRKLQAKRGVQMC
ncbi:MULTISPECIES: CynX/NimT family MFS transporter [Marinobacter]|uniref:MFS transporter n=1 Tax=Marinobacter TaxID=2742 RepID=UPI00124767C1|nr:MULTISPECIES: MFS transporter [Marinobacter]MBL3556929.1 MFS transporter [Marinobacter sp. JB05H06]